jgi:predicted DNA-binding transcriptional regulator YafY
VIADATWRERRLSARYREGPRIVRRTLEPLGLVLKGGAWYLVAHRSVGMRVYRVSRFTSVRVREEGFERPEDFDLGTYWAEWSRTFEASRPRVEVKIRASDLALRLLPRDLQGGNGVFTVGFGNLEEAFRELLKFGPDAEVLEPAELRERIARTAGEVAELYSVRAVR